MVRAVRVAKDIQKERHYRCIVLLWVRQSDQHGTGEIVQYLGKRGLAGISDHSKSCNSLFLDVAFDDFAVFSSWIEHL